ncbi:3-oxoacyl-[acyl-carrier protein] reductase [hydrothermal vent metagenome]|uniref:3-oxoacyl-[acyl-carrier protein] reductase n=1 Tax=hydrothermal vent metagenome TaxID=652676 RepID=A0A3B0TI57_9ZZZZ
MPHKNSYIKSYCHIEENTVSLNGKPIYENEDDDFSVFIKSAYNALEVDYPKFFKMDGLSKLAFLAADVLLKHEKTTPTKEENIAIVLSNKASSLDTDRRHQESIQDKDNFYPSPTIFVYTLPNICIGEISIKYKMYSENSFFIFDTFNPDYLVDYCNSLLDENKADKVLCGWVDLDKEQYKAFLYIIDDKGSILHNTEELKQLF